MGNRIKLYAIILIAAVTASCEEFRFGGPQEVKLYARFNASGLQTKSADSSYVYHNQTVEAGGIPVALSRIDEKDAAYPSFSNCGPYATAKLLEPDASGIREMHFDKAQFFKNSTDDIKYAGFAPVPTSQSQYSSTAQGTTVTYPVNGYSDVMYGSVITGREGYDFPTMYFSHALSEVRVWVYQTVAVDEDGNIVETLDDWGSFDSMTFTGMIDQCTLTLPKDADGTWGVNYGTSTSDMNFTESSPLYFNPGAIPMSSTEKRKVGMALIAPPDDNQLNIKYKTSGVNEEKTVTIAKEFLPGYAYDVILRFTQFGIIEADVTIGDWIGKDGEFTDIFINQGVKVYNNLSRYGTANSYIISSGNFLYGFDCTVKGNGDANLVADSDVTLNVNHLEILWHDLGDIDKDYIKLSSKPSDNLAKVEIGGNKNNNDHTLTKEGNILVGGFDKEGGTLLWTWHLWLTKKVEAPGDGNGYNVMDRNLGASSSARNGGLMYQWGRMTPLRSNGTESNGDVASAIQNAVSGYNTVYGTSGNDWLASGRENLTTLWGFQSDFKDQEKTIYDPCPLGYVVADKQVWAYNASAVGGDDVWTAASPAYSVANHFNGTIGQADRNALKHVRCIAEGKESRYVKNLSESQTANCYIVSKAGYYKFNVLTRGNGVAALEPMGGGGRIWNLDDGMGTTIRSIDIDTVMPRWWQGNFNIYGSWNNIDPQANWSELDRQMGGIRFLRRDGSWSYSSADVDDEGYVTFQVENWKAGNLLIAAYDLYNNVLWSWHLWFTEEPQNKKQGSFALLDRNLGATYAPDGVNFNNENQRWSTYGFFYQWGRKDPLFHDAPSNNKTEGTINGNKASSSIWYFNDPKTGWTRRNDVDINGANSSMSVNDARLYPETFFKAGAQNNANSVWFLPTYANNKETLNSTAFWGYAVYSTLYGRSFTKTLYDPCPPGYRTLSHDALFLNAGDNGYGPTDITNYNQGGRMVVGKGTYGIVTNYNGDNIFWPYSGRRNYNGKTEAITTSCNYTTGMPMGQYNSRSGEFSRSYNTHSHKQNAGDYGTSTGMVVRCMKE